jgi:hypothetical protein
MENVALPCVPGCKITLNGDATEKDVWEEYLFCLLAFMCVPTVANIPRANIVIAGVHAST